MSCPINREDYKELDYGIRIDEGDGQNIVIKDNYVIEPCNNKDCPYSKDGGCHYRGGNKT